MEIILVYSSTKLYNVTSDTELLRELNTQIHSKIRRVLSKDAVAVMDHDQIDINDLIDEIPPKLWQAVTLLTESVSERRGTSTVSKSDSASYHIKRIIRFFLLCCMMFITDDRCSIPLHILIADLVEGQGGSAWLHKILNRLGVCASADTLSRFIQHKCTTVDMSDMYANDSFTVISADNIDYLHKYARVVRGNGNSSWHGTTIQLVQPLPSFSLFGPFSSANQGALGMQSVVHLPLSNTVIPEKGFQMHATVCRKRTERSSPLPSPMKTTRSPKPKQKRRMRTGSEQNSVVQSDVASIELHTIKLSTI